MDPLSAVLEVELYAVERPNVDTNRPSTANGILLREGKHQKA
jgi:hypothetical protein